MSNQHSRFRRLCDSAVSLFDESALPHGCKVSRWRRFVHFWVMVGRSFARNRCPIRASALAYGTLLALIPMLAVVMSVTSSFLKQEGEKRIDELIVKLVATVTPSATVSTNKFASVAGKTPDGQTAPTESSQATNSAGGERLEGSVNTNAPAGTKASLAEDERVVEMRKSAARNINQFIQNTQSGALGVTGSVLLIFAAISMLTRI